MFDWTVIGASSFIGSHFCKLLDAKQESYQAVSLREPFSFHPTPYVVNFAAVNIVAPSWDIPAAYCEVNLMRQLELWNYLRTDSLRHYVHVSTPEVFGTQPGPLPERAVYRPSTPYAVSRAAAEMMLECYRRQWEFPVSMTRSVNVYGPGQQGHRLIPKLIDSIRAGRRFPLEGGGTSTRGFLHVRDACMAIYLVALKGEDDYNIGAAEVFVIHDLIRLICAKMGADFDQVVELVPERPGKDMRYRLVDRRIREELGWSPRISMEQGLTELLA